MDSTYSSQGYDSTCSRSARSRSGSGVSTTEGLLQNLRLAEASLFETGSYTSSRPPSSRGLASPAYLSPSLSHTPGYLSTPLSQQQQQPFPSYPSAASQAQWFEEEQSRARGTPLLRLEPADDQFGAPTSSPPLPSIETDTMSTVAASYDAAFSMGARSAFTWPVMESSNGLMAPDLHPYGSDASLTPPSGSRSATASPPRTGLTPEQRELKRQRDQARHHSKMQARSRRADSASSSVYSIPSTMPDMTSGASNMPVYTTSSSQISLLTEPAAPQYMPTYSPPLQDQNQANMYANPYPPQPYIPDYGYPPSTSPSLPSHYGRPLMPDPNLGMYPIPPIIPPGPPDVSGQVRVVHSRPKPQCWEHGCNGRQFSTFSNLLRHQREKSGQAAKASCPNCGAEFTRTTARNGHLLHDKCKRKGSN